MGLDLARALAVLSIAFVTEIWQIYVLIFLLNACSAGFTPTFQAVIPDLLDDADTYTEALSLSRLAYELEAIASPAIAAALLGLVSYSGLFAVNSIAFLISAGLVLGTVVPQPGSPPNMEQRHSAGWTTGSGSTTSAHSPPAGIAGTQPGGGRGQR